MSKKWPVLRFATSFVFGLVAGNLLNIPESFPLHGVVWKTLVGISAMRAAPVDGTLVAWIRGKLTAPRIQLMFPILLDLVAMALIAAFLDLPGTAFSFIGKIMFVAVVAGAIPGWPDGGKQFVALLKGNAATRASTA